MGLSNKLSCEAGSSSCHHNPHRFYSQRFWGFISLHWNPWLHGLSHSPVVSPDLSTCKCGTTSHHIAKRPLCAPSCPSPPLLPVWMNVSSLTPWLSGFHTVWFSGSSSCFLFLILLLSFFWLCKKEKSIYLHLHLGWKSHVRDYFMHHT